MPARWNVLQYDLDIARTVKIFGWIGMTLAVLWVVWHWWRDHNRPENSAGASSKNGIVV